MSEIFPQILDFFLQNDKQKHILVTFGIFVFDVIVRFFWIQKRKGLFVAFSFAFRDAICIGIGKEIFDAFGFGTPDILDIVADILGIAFPVYLFISYKELERLPEVRLFQKTPKFWHHIMKSTKNFLKEGSEGIYFQCKSWIARIQQKPDTSQTRSLHLQIKREWSQSKKAWNRMKKVYFYTVSFLFFAIGDFLVEIIRMPFFIIIRGSQFIGRITIKMLFFWKK